MTTYQAGGAEWMYPRCGDPLPTAGAKVLLLTEGGIATVGSWDNAFCVGWLPLPKRNKDKEALI